MSDGFSTAFSLIHFDVYKNSMQRNRFLAAGNSRIIVYMTCKLCRSCLCCLLRIVKFIVSNSIGLSNHKNMCECVCAFVHFPDEKKNDVQILDSNSGQPFDNQHSCDYSDCMIHRNLHSSLKM